MTTSIVLETSKGNMGQAAVLGVLLLALSLSLVGLAAMVRTRRRSARVSVLGMNCRHRRALPKSNQNSSRFRKPAGRFWRRSRSC